MERTSAHRESDKTLRPDFINQVSLDEFILSVYPEISEPEDRLAIAAEIASLDRNGNSPEQVAQMMLERAATDWALTLVPGTSLNEVLYLQGKTDVAERAAEISAWNRAHAGTDKEVPELEV